jgi:hypothetical protein
MLERKIRDLTTRILELEQALSSTHAQYSQTTHPLLKNDHLGIITAEEEEDTIDDPLDMPEQYVFKDLNSPKWIVASGQSIGSPSVVLNYTLRRRSRPIVQR